MGRPPEITRAERLRRVCIIASNFTRNIAYYRASRNGGNRVLPAENFWVNLEGNCIDIAILEWYKLFADNAGRHSWSRIVADADVFEADLLQSLGCDADQFEQIVRGVRNYRDRFIAHLDNDRTMHIPAFDPLINSTRFYFTHVVTNEMREEERRLIGLTDLDAYYQRCLDEATTVFATHLPE
ncbi:MAG: hypothetical protein AAF583_00710 [Pseudomonadota bacterium]